MSGFKRYTFDGDQWRSTCSVAMTIRLAFWKTSSSLQVGLCRWTLFAITLCQRKNRILIESSAGFWFVLGSPNTANGKLERGQFNDVADLRKSLSALSIFIMCGTGLLKRGTCIEFRIGIRPLSSVRKEPFWKDLIVFIHGSLVL